MPSPILPSTSSFSFPGRHADNPNDTGPHGGSSADGGRPDHGIPGHDGQDNGPADNDGTPATGPGQDDGTPASGTGRSDHGVPGHADRGGGGDNAGSGTAATPGQTNGGLSGGGDRGTGAGSNIYGNGGTNAGSGPYAGGAPTAGNGGVFGQVSQVTSTIASAVFGSAVTYNPSTLPNLFSEQLPHFVGDSATIAQPAYDRNTASPAANPLPRVSAEAAQIAPHAADPPAQASTGPAANQDEGRALGPTQAQTGPDVRSAQIVAPPTVPSAPAQAPPEPPAGLPGALAAGALSAEALERALAQSEGKAFAPRADGEDVASLQRRGILADGPPSSSQQAALSRQPAEALDRLLARVPLEAHPAVDARATDGRMPDPRMLDPRVADARSADPSARSMTEAPPSRPSADPTKAAATLDGRAPVAADGKPNTLSSFGRGLFGGSAEYMRQALDWVGQHVREFGIGASPDADGARAMRVVAGLVVASVGVLLVIGVLYALRIIFLA
ncbi:MAG: hypothetical protein ABI843_08400 [Dokdonella sp.]